VQGGGVYQYRLLTIEEILRTSSRPSRCNENFCYGSFCGASFCCLALMFAALQTRRFAAQQTCDQRSGIASGSKLERRALKFYFPVISYYMFPSLKCRGGWDLGLRVTSGLAKRMQILQKRQK